MKKLVLTLVICLGCMGILGAQNIWKPINGTGILGVGPDGSIFAYSEYGALSRSQDEGETWQIVLGQETGFTGHINSSCFAVSNEGRICVFNDNQQTVVYSDDNGDTWQQTTSMSSCAMPDKTGLCAPTNDIFVVWAENGEINYSLDGGETWNGWIPDFMNADNGPAISDLLVNENGDVYLGLRTIGGEGGIFRSTLSDMQNWEIAAGAGLAIMDMEFDPEGNVVACGWRTEGSIGFQHTPGFYLFDGTSLAIGDGGIVYTPQYSGLQAVLSYSTDHGEHFTEIGEHLPLVDIAPGGENARLFKGYDNHLYFDGGGEYWKCILDADHITNDGNYVPLIHEGNDRQKWNVVYIGANEYYPNDYFTEIQSIRDNITLDGVDYKLVWRESVHESKRIAGAVREEDKRVYFRRYWQQSYQDEVLLYDFNLTVGDTVSVGWGDYQLIVLEESEVEVDGTMRRQLGLAMCFGDGTTGEVEEYWIEGVGSTYGFMNSGIEGWTGAFVHLLCYYENGNLIWDNEAFDDCVMNSDGAPATFAPQGAEWYFDVGSFMGSPTTYFHMEVLGDTIIQDHTCSVISPQYLGGNGMNQFVYEENRKVYWYNQTLQAFTTLYDFNAEVGDSWICEIDSCAYEVTVTEITSYSGWGHVQDYRAQRVTYSGELGYSGGGTIIDGIGEISGLFPYPYACIGEIYDGQYPDWLRCYLVDGEMVLHLGAYDCDEQGYCWDGTVAEAYAGGDGTEENPYQIANAKQLALLAQQTNDGTGGDAYYKLIEDINLASCNGGIQQWVSIGTPEHPFTGHFDGWSDAKTILNMHQTIADGDVQPVGGLFGCTNGAEISNVRLAQCYVRGNAQYVGTLVGYAGLTNIYNCSIYDGRASTDKQYAVAGGLIGLAGYTYGEQGTSQQSYSIMACQVQEAVKVEASVAGGVVGQVNELGAKAQYVLDGCAMCGIVDSFCVQGGSATGGIVGIMWYATMVRCTNNQKVVGGLSQGGGCIGGIVGMVGYGSVEECINNETGQISGNEGVRYVNAGGIIGAIHSSDESSIRDCQNYADVSGTSFCGGIVGIYHMSDDSIPCFVQNCYNHSSVTSHPLGNSTVIKSVGGIVGHVGEGFGNLCIVECGNLGGVVMESEEQGDAGGILGSREEGHVYIVNVFNRGSVSAPIYAGGIIGGGENIGDCTIQNVYNAGEVITGQEIKGAIAYNRQETDHFSDCYWLDRENHASVSEGEPLENSCAFHPTESPTEWLLDSIQYGITDLLEALNSGAEALVEQYPMVLALIHRWQPDTDLKNDGFPVFSGIEVGYPFVGTEWYYEIEDENGNLTYQHLEYAADTTVNNKDVVIIIRTNTLYDKSEHTEVTREYVYEENGIIYWWNKDLEEFTSLYDFGAEAGDEWEIKVGTESITMHVDSVAYQEYEGCLYKMLIVSDENGLFNGTIVCGIGHLTSFFPEKLMTRGKDYRVDGMRCYWRNGELVFKYGDRDCDEVYEEWHNGIDEDDPSTGLGTFAVYPNPTHGVLVVETVCTPSLPDQTYRISNVMGQTLVTGAITAETQQIDVTNLPEGMYFITFAGVTRKFVVNR